MDSSCGRYPLWAVGVSTSVDSVNEELVMVVLIVVK